MFALAVGIGIYSYIIFILGVERLLYAPLVYLLTLIFWGEFVWWRKTVILNVAKNLKRFKIQDLRFKKDFGKASMTWKGLFHNQSLFVMIVVGLIILQILVNLIGVFGPEIAFDATWYHLTLPKLFLEWHKIVHIQGGLLYYSDMPKLTEMLYIPAIALFGETGAKLVHFFFGILCCLALYKLARKFFSPFLSLITVTIFYTNLVVGWESISAYIDLSRTFFSVMTVWGFLNWFETKRTEWLLGSAICAGLGISTKFLALVDLGIFLPIIAYIDWKRKPKMIKDITLFVIISLLIPVPWWLYAYLQTGNPFYPFFTPLYPTVSSLNLNPVGFFATIWNQFTHSADPVSPLYISFLPFLFVVKKRDKKFILLLLIGALSIIIWYISPQTGGGRFLLPYLPVLSLLVVCVYKNLKQKYVQKMFVACLLISLLTSIGYRVIANAKFVPVILGKQTKAQFLANHLNFSFGDYYDIDGFMAKHIKSTDTVLLYGYHNLYYVDFPYIHYTWVKKGDIFNYIATDGRGLPTRFNGWKLIYQNPTTHLHVYSDGGAVWLY